MPRIPFLKMALKKTDNSQTISAKDITGDVIATNVKVEEGGTLMINQYIEIKDYVEGDKESWESEESIISIYDLVMIKEIMDDAKEVEETLPMIEKYLPFFKLLSNMHRGLFVNAIQMINKEDKISKKFGGDKEVLDEESLKILDRLNEEDSMNKYIYSSDYGDDFKKIYNLIRCGDIEKKVLPKIQLFKNTLKDSWRIEEAFERYWNRRLDSHPYAVFVNSWGKKERIMSEILDKFDNSENEFVRIYAKSDARIMLVRTICEEIKKMSTSKDFIENEYILGSRKAAEFIFNKI